MGRTATARTRARLEQIAEGERLAKAWQLGKQLPAQQQITK